MNVGCRGYAANKTFEQFGRQGVLAECGALYMLCVPETGVCRIPNLSKR